MKIFSSSLIAALLLTAIPPTRAEDGYDLWLRYVAPEAPARTEAIRQASAEIVVPGGSATAEIVRSELKRGLSGLSGITVPSNATVSTDGAVVAGTPSGLDFLKSDEWAPSLASVGNDGYVIRSTSVNGHRATVIAANTDIGSLYGAFHLLRLVQTGQPLDRISVTEKPKIQLRLLDHWDNLDGTIERGYAGNSLWKWEELPGKIDPRYRDYARADASIGINGVVLTNGNADPRILRADYLAKVAALADVFRPYGIKVFLAADFDAPMRPAAVPKKKDWGGIGDLNTADPSDPRVRAWWKAKADEIYQLIPDFGGWMVKADSEGMPGPEDYGRTHADGANLLAAALAPHDGTVLWRAFVYPKDGDPDRIKRPFQTFAPLDGRFAGNVFVQIKNGPLDFQPREPFHPLFGAMPRTSLMLELQVTQEYLGHASTLVYLAPLWKQVLDSDTYARGPGSTVARVIDGTVDHHPHSGIIGVANTGSDRNWTGHLFGQANWYAFGRLAWDPDLSAEAIAREWIAMTWKPDPKVMGPLTSMMLGSWPATVDFMAPLGLSITSDSEHYDPDPAHRAGKLWLATKAGIGFDRTTSGSNAVSQYNEPLRSRLNSLESCPEDYLLWFHFVPWSHPMPSGQTLWEALVRSYRSGVQYVDGMARTWESVAGSIDPERYQAVQAKLAEEARYARTWRDTYLGFFSQVSGNPLLADAPLASWSWDFGRIEKNVIQDSSGKSVGSLDGASPRKLASGKTSLSFSMPAISATFRWPPSPAPTSLTATLWVDLWSADTSAWLLRSRDFRLGAYRGNLFLRFRTDDKFQILGTYPDAKASLGVGLGRWHEVAAVYDAGHHKVSLFVDGRAVAQTAIAGTPVALTPSDLETGGTFTGLLADVRLYANALSPEQIQGLYESDKASFQEIALPPQEATSHSGWKERPVTPADRALHEAWLAYRPAEISAAQAYAPWLRRIVAPEGEATLQTAAHELDQAIRQILGTSPSRGSATDGSSNVIVGSPATSPLVAQFGGRLHLEEVGPQGYSLQSFQAGATHSLVIAANSPAGVIAGTFALIRRLQLGEPMENLNVIDAPKIGIRIVNHWDYFRGFADDAWMKNTDNLVTEGERNDSIYSWADLRSGNTSRIREWARLLASAGYNAVCPTELNWSEKNNFLDHLGEVKVLAGIFRDYGIRLYWTPNYLLAPLKSTAEALYGAVPDFGGYLLKFGSEGQPGDPGPGTVNAIARLLAPHGGTVLVRGFIYGKYSPIEGKVRELIPYRFFTSVDGQYDRNVVVIGKSSPLDFEIREPINPLDGALKKTRYGTEVMISKDFPMSWLASWKRWMDFDNHRRGPESLNRDSIDTALGIAMITPNVPWTSNPLNMINYYGLGRLGWNPAMTVQQIRDEWIRMTFGSSPATEAVVTKILTHSDAVAENLMLYHGYRGVWIEFRDGALRTKLPFPQRITATGIGSDGEANAMTSDYAPQVKAFYDDPRASEDLLLFFHYVPYTYVLNNGQTVRQDMENRLQEGVEGANSLLAAWKTLEGQIDPRYFTYTTKLFESYAMDAASRQKEVEAGLSSVIASK